jgi:hypothetical protein
VGSNYPTLSISYILVKYGIKLSLFLVNVEQIQRQCPYYIERGLMRRCGQCARLYISACSYCLELTVNGNGDDDTASGLDRECQHLEESYFSIQLLKT